MAKNIIKEIIIFLLLTLAIILILGVLLYKYVPSNKIIPETISYTTSENVKTEIQTDESVDTSEVVVTYQIDSTDLSNYKRIQEYVPGKKNPFATTAQETTGQNPRYRCGGLRRSTPDRCYHRRHHRGHPRCHSGSYCPCPAGPRPR